MEKLDSVLPAELSGNNSHSLSGNELRSQITAQLDQIQ
jgi:hypothetical protein